MSQGIRSMYRNKIAREDGFTIIEVLTVVAIIGTLSTISMPIFMGKRKVAIEATLFSDVRNAAMEMEKQAVFSDSGYADEIPETFFSSEDNMIVIDSSRSDAHSYCIIGSSPNYEDLFVYYHSDIRIVTTDMNTCGFTPMEDIEDMLPLSPGDVIPPFMTTPQPNPPLPSDEHTDTPPPVEAGTPTSNPIPEATKPPSASLPSLYAPPPKGYDDKNKKKYTICHKNGKGLELPLPAILNGHSHNHVEDIIPVIPGKFTGQNWTPEGSAIWHNNCSGMDSINYMG